MDWAIGQGLLGLQTSVNKRDAVKQELGVLQILDQQMRQDKADKEASQLKEQAYQAEISKFADTLLAPDRDRINQKSKILSMRIREHIKTNGGDMEKFFANGGHRLMSDYKSDIINSTESSQFLDNKKNMEIIVEMQSKGFGHLINPTDLANLENFQKTGNGKVTYTGMMSEIEMPNDDKYEYGMSIPAKDILYKNYMKIMGNYKLTHPNTGEPTEADLLAFTAAHYGEKGSNWQKSHQEKVAKDNHIEAISKIQADERMNAADNAAEIEKEKIKAMADMAKGSGRGGRGGAGGDGADGGSAGGGFGPGEKGYKSQYTADVAQVFSNVPKYGLKAKDFQQGWWNKYEYPDLAKNTLGEDFVMSSEDYMDGGDGDWSSWYASGYQPRNAKKLRLDTTAVTKAVLGDSYTLENGYLKAVKLDKNLGWFDAAGRKISDWNDSAWYGDDDYLQEEENQNKDFKVLGPITVGVAKTADGKENMIMNVVDGKGSTSIDKDATSKYDERLGDSDITMRAALAIQSDDGHTFYIPFDPTVSKVQSDIDAYDKGNDTTDEEQSVYQRSSETKQKNASTAQKEARINEFWNATNGDKQTAASIYGESVALGVPKSPQSREKLIKSFYGALASFSGQTSDYSEAAKDQYFSMKVNQLIEKGYSDIKKDLNKLNGNISDDKIIEKMKLYNPEEAELYDSWKINYNYLMRKK